MKRRIVRAVQKYVVNPPMRLALTLGVLPPTHALLETIGRVSGHRRRNPVGNGLADDDRTFWIVAEHGHHASYVRNIESDPNVRVRIGRQWRTGRATLCPDDDPLTRLHDIGHKVNGFMVRTLGTDLLSIRIDLDDLQGGRGSGRGAAQRDGSSGATGTEIAGASVPPSTSNTLPVTHDDASETR